MSHQVETDVAVRNAASGSSFKRSGAALILTAIATTLLGACSSGSGGTDVTIGSGQNSDPVTLDFPVFYVKRPVPDPEAEEDLIENPRELMRFEIGADLYMRSRASPSAPETNLTAAETAGLGDIRDLEVNYDGTKVIFSMRAKFIENADEEDQPTWNIWEYDTVTRVLRRIIQSDTIEEEGHDIMPHYLPDDRIVFSSTRQRQSRAMLLDENKPQYAAQDEDDNEPAFVLHVMDPDGTNIRQISFNQSHDIDPSVLANGKIVFTRWEHHTDDNQLDLYTVNPDGSELQLLYGAHSHATGDVPPGETTPSIIQFLGPRAMQDGRTLALVRADEGTNEGGDLILIDTANFVDNTQPLAANAGLAGPAQTRALPTDVRTIPGPSPGGRYRSAAPLFDGSNRLLVSWSQCRLLEAGRIVPCTSDRLNATEPPPVEAPPLFGVYIYDVRQGTQLPIVPPQEGFILTEVVAAFDHPVTTRPAVVLDHVAGVDFPIELESENAGVLNIRSVYDINGVVADPVVGSIEAVRNPSNPAYATRPARFIRIEKAVSLPDEDIRDVPNTAFGPQGRGRGMRDVLGYAPVEPDGSVKTKVPANVPFMISILDRNGRRIGPQHNNWLQVVPGEELQCNGCHNPNSTPERAHGRKGLSGAINAGAPSSGLFPNTNAVLMDSPNKTMAETRWTVMCDRAPPAERGGNCELSVNLMFDDIWTTAAPTRFDACYGEGATNFGSNPGDLTLKHVCTTDAGVSTPLPTSQGCVDDWSSRCRITIHYEQHIHPLWGLDRNVLDPNDPTIILQQRTCTNCHAPVNPNNTAMAAVPAGQLDLTDGPSADEADHYRAYRELLFDDNEQILANGAIVDRLLQVGVDPVTGAPQFEPVTLNPPMSAAGARASGRFFTEMETATGGVDHRDFMTPGELRLLSEWLDIGAQYYNDPFVAPEN